MVRLRRLNLKGKIPKWFWNVGKETLRRLNLSFNILSKFEQTLIVLPWKNMNLLDLKFQYVARVSSNSPIVYSLFFGLKK